MTPRHHIADDLLVSYAGGGLAEGWSLAVATHLSFCPHCRTRLAAAEAAGGQLLETLASDPVSPDAWSAVRARLSPRPAEPAPVPTAVSGGVFPRPLQDYIGGDADSVAWRNMGKAGAQSRLRTADTQTQVRLLRIPAGRPVPEHGHRGRELTVVLSGAFTDGDTRFERGDVEDADADVEHIPTATPEADCICLAVTDAPLRFRSLVVRVLQPFLGI